MDAFYQGQESLADVIAHLDDLERDLDQIKARVREYRYTLFSSLQAQDLDNELDDLVD